MIGLGGEAHDTNQSNQGQSLDQEPPSLMMDARLEPGGGSGHPATKKGAPTRQRLDSDNILVVLDHTTPEARIYS